MAQTLDRSRQLGLSSGQSKAFSSLLREIACAPAVEPDSSWRRALLAGAVIGRFELVREVGRGGFGVVWEARDRALGRSVAFKAVLSRACAPALGEQLPREAEAATHLSHPNIVTLHDVGRTEHGPYLVLELLKGETLGRRLDRGPIAPGEAVRVAVEIARGLSHAHAQGVVHRDLTPGNVFLCEDGQVKLLDLGMAHAFGLRRIGGGTRSHMAPEQWRGAPEDERTDVFALGVLLYQMLVGELPFGGDGRGVGGALLAWELEVSEPRGLGPLVSRMLEQDPVRRPRDGGEALAELSELLHKPERSPSGTESLAPVRKRRHVSARLAFAAGLAVASLAAAGVIGAARIGAAPDRSPASASGPVTLAVLPLANLSNDAAQEYFSDGLTEEITGKLSRLAGLAVTARTSASRYKNASRSAKEIGAELGAAYLLEGSVRRAGDQIRVSATLVRAADERRVWSDEIDATLDDVFAVQEWVATQIVEALDVRLGPGEAGSLGTFGTRSAAAYDEYLRGLKVSEDFHPRGLAAALGHFERAARIDPQFAQALASQASAEARVYRNVDGNPEHLERAKALVERTLAIDSGLSRALFASGEVRAATYDYQGAAEVFRQVVALEPRSYIAWDSLCWALGYVTPPQTTEAEKACRQSIEVNPAFDGSYYHLERVLLQGGRLAEAQQALTQLEQRFPDSPTIRPGRFWFSMGAKRPQEALTLLEQERVLEGTALGLAWRALALAQLGELDRSLRRLDEALAHGYRDLAALRGDPYLEPLRRDPRFAALLAKYHLPSQAPPSLREGGTLPSRSTSDLGPHINRPAEAEAPWDSPRSAHAVPGD